MKSLTTEMTGKLLGKFNPNWSPLGGGAEEFPVSNGASTLDAVVLVDRLARVIRTKKKAQCVFRSKAITDSGSCRSPVPGEADHRFRTKPIAERLSRSQPS